MIINCPTNFQQGNATNFVRNIFLHHEIQNLTISFSHMGFIDPYSSLIVAHGMKTFLYMRNKKGLKTNLVGHEANAGAVGYLKHLGFFRFFGVRAGKDVDEAWGNSRYLPFTRIKRSQIMWKGHVMQDEIDLKSERLAKVIFPDNDNFGPAMMLAYAIREIIRNSFEHGNVDQCIVTAQRWVNGEAEIAIADEGIGIFNSLGTKKNYSTAEEAISASLQPGISSESVKDDDRWANTGFGLYVVSELGKRYGEFEITSSSRTLHFDKTIPRVSHSPLIGTFVKLKISTKDADYFPNILAQIVGDGEKMAGTLPGAKKSASKMSKTPLPWSNY